MKKTLLLAYSVFLLLNHMLFSCQCNAGSQTIGLGLSFAPVGLTIKYFEPKVRKGEIIEVPVAIYNDLNNIFTGNINLYFADKNFLVAKK